MTETQPSTTETFLSTINIGDEIICPSDGTNIKWEITKIEQDGTILAQVKNGEATSKFYPKTIKIAKEAYHGWKKIN
jgi:hypothetical protein